MHINWHWPGLVWFEHTAENAASGAATAAIGVMTAEQTHALSDVGWGSVASVAGYAAMYAVLRALATLNVSNGTDSFLPNVVAKGKQT